MQKVSDIFTDSAGLGCQESAQTLRPFSLQIHYLCFNKLVDICIMRELKDFLTLIILKVIHYTQTDGGGDGPGNHNHPVRLFMGRTGQLGLSDATQSGIPNLVQYIEP